MADLQTELVRATKAVLELIPPSERQGSPVFRGHATGTIVPPYITVQAQSAQETPWDTGNYNTQMLVEVHGPADPKHAVVINAHGTTVASVFSALGSGTLHTALTASGSLYCFGVFDRQHLPQRHSERHFVSGMQFTAYACEKPLS